MTTRTSRPTCRLAAMEAALKPRVLETLDLIASDFAKLSEMQDARIRRPLTKTDLFRQSREDLSKTALGNC